MSERIASMVVATILVGCGEDVFRCDFDDQCDVGLVCEEATRTCVEPPPACAGMCERYDTCDFAPFADDFDGCLKDWCGQSFFGGYRDLYGRACYDAWVALDGCTASLTCTQLEEENAELGASDASRSVYCQPQLDAKNSACH